LFALTDCFDLSGFCFAAVFTRLEWVWEAIKRVHSFIDKHCPAAHLIGKETQLMPGAIFDQSRSSSEWRQSAAFRLCQGQHSGQ
jgi:hypothetical protein